MKPDQSVFFQKSAALPFVEMRKANRSSACYHTHSHDEFSFGVIDDGQAEYKNLRVNNTIGKGHTVTINPGDAHSCNPNSGAWSYRMLFVDTHWISHLQQEFGSFGGADYQPFHQPLSKEPNHYRIFDQLFNNLLNPSAALAAETQLILFLVNQFETASQVGKTETIDDHGAYQVKELIMDQLEDNLTLECFSEQSGLSRYHLIRSFKARYGQSPHAYQLDQRIKKAKTLLQQGLSLVDTATQLGFADQSHFQRNFKKRIAVTPKQYQSFFILP